MAFSIQGMSRFDSGANNPITILQPSKIPADNNARFAVGTFKTIQYQTNTDTLDDVGVPGYFDSVWPDFKVGDLVIVHSAPDTEVGTFYVSAVDLNSATIVTLERFNLGPGAITTAKFADGSVTYQKMQDVAANSLIGNPTEALASPEDIAVSTNFIMDGGFLSIDPELILRDAGNITAAQFNGMYAAPIQLTNGTAAAGKKYVVVGFYLRQSFGAAQYAAGGSVAVQYGNAIHGAGTQASAAIPAGSITGMAADSAVQVRGNTFFQTALTGGQALYLSNDTAAFTTGDGDWDYSIVYREIPV